MSEPDWEAFRIDRNWDTPGLKQVKLEGFVAAFIDWKRDTDLIPQGSYTASQETPKKTNKRKGKRGK